MKRRGLYLDIWRDLASHKAMIFLVGPRQAGKTTLARMIAESFPNQVYFNWDLMTNKRLLMEKPTFFEEVNRKNESVPLVVFDEIHKYRRWKNYLKGIYDQFSGRYKFLVLGSGRLDIFQKGGDSLAGRYFQFTLWPFTLAELVGHRRPFREFIRDPLRVSKAGAVDDVWNRRPGTEFDLQDKDEVILYASSVKDVLRRQVAVYGAVKGGGRYEWKRGMTLSDLLREGEGFKDDAYFAEAEIARVPPGGLKGDSLATILRVAMIDDESWLADLDSAAVRILRGDGPAGRFLLEPNDNVFIRSNPDFQRPETVVLAGEIVVPGRYILRSRNETLRDIIRRAGGLTKESYAGGGQIIRNGQRLFLNFDDLLIHGKKRENVVLQPGDSIYIPPKPSVVMVRGEVMSPGYFKYLRGASARDYLVMAGGRTENGGRILVQQPTGRSYQYSMWKHPRPEDGAVIMVYPKPVKPKGEQTDWGSIIKDSFAIAASAATVIVLVDKMK